MVLDISSTYTASWNSSLESLPKATSTHYSGTVYIFIIQEESPVIVVETVLKVPFLTGNENSGTTQEDIRLKL